MKNRIRLRRSYLACTISNLDLRAAKRRELGIMAGIGSLLDLAGTGFSFRAMKRTSGFEADVQNLRGDFDVAVERVSQTHPQIRIEG